MNFKKIGQNFKLQLQKNDRHWLALGLVAGLSLAAWILSLCWSGPYVFDDFLHIVYSPVLTEPPRLEDFFGPIWGAHGATWAYRPLVSLTYFLENKFDLLIPGWQRVFNLGIHLLNAVLTLKIARSIKANSLAPYFVILFFFHPVAWHSVLYVSARSTLLVVFFILLTIYLYAQPRGWRALALLACGLAVLAKEIGLLALPLAFLIYPNQFKSDCLQLKKKWPIFLIGLVLLIAALIFRRALFFDLWNAAAKTGTLRHPLFAYILTQFQALSLYLWLMFAGSFFWSFTHEIPLADFSNLQPWLYCIGVLLFFFLCIFIARKRNSAPSFYWLFAAFLLSFAPEFFYPRELLATEQRMYLGLILAVLIGSQWTYSRPLRWPLILGGILFLSINIFATAQRSETYSSYESLLLHEIERYPNNKFAKAVLADHYLGLGQFKKSSDLFEETVIEYGKLKAGSPWYEEEQIKSYLGLIMALSQQSEPAKLETWLQNCVPQLNVKESYCLLFKAKSLNLRRQYQATLELLASSKIAMPALELEHFFALFALQRWSEANALVPELLPFYNFDENFLVPYLQLLKITDSKKAKEFWIKTAEEARRRQLNFSQRFWSFENSN